MKILDFEDLKTVVFFSVLPRTVAVMSGTGMSGIFGFYLLPLFSVMMMLHTIFHLKTSIYLRTKITNCPLIYYYLLTLNDMLGEIKYWFYNPLGTFPPRFYSYRNI